MTCYFENKTMAVTTAFACVKCTDKDYPSYVPDTLFPAFRRLLSHKVGFEGKKFEELKAYIAKNDIKGVKAISHAALFEVLEFHREAMPQEYFTIPEFSAIAHFVPMFVPPENHAYFMSVLNRVDNNCPTDGFGKVLKFLGKVIHGIKMMDVFEAYRRSMVVLVVNDLRIPLVGYSMKIVIDDAVVPSDIYKHDCIGHANNACKYCMANACARINGCFSPSERSSTDPERGIFVVIGRMKISLLTCKVKVERDGNVIDVDHGHVCCSIKKKCIQCICNEVSMFNYVREDLVRHQ